MLLDARTAAVLALPAAVAMMACLPVRAAPTPSDAPVERAARIPVSSFARAPTLRFPTLSPNGQRLLARTTINGREEVIVQEFSTGKARALPRPESATSEINWTRWAGNERVLVSIYWTVKWRTRKLRATRLFEYDLASGVVRLLGKESVDQVGDTILHVDPQGDWLLLQLAMDMVSDPGVYRVDLASGTMTEEQKPRARIYRWVADNAGVVRLGLGRAERGTYVLYRAGGNDIYTRIQLTDYDVDRADIDQFFLVPGSETGFALSGKRTGRLGLYQYNFATRELGEAVFENPEYDVDDVDLSEDGRSLMSVSYLGSDYERVWFDPSMMAHQAAIDAQLPDRGNHIVSWSRGRSRLLVHSFQGIDPGAYYVYQTATRTLTRIAEQSPGLDPAALAPMEYVEYRARDGTNIPAYLTVPVGREPKQLPLVVLPHGGPFGVRDEWGYDAQVQYLANLGYAVLQPNYRGSGGYGIAFEQKGWGEWGRKMQDDLDDGVDWLVREGTVDAKRVAIYGGSYGGYAALWGATRSPQRYRCGASLAGVTDLQRILDYDRDYMMPRSRVAWREKLEGEERFDLRAVSPLQQVAQLKVPVLVVHGARDVRVPLDQFELYIEALKKSGKTYVSHLYPDEGHGVHDPANRGDWLEKLGMFFGQCNPADTAPAPSPARP
jgi:dipeptidyl aminopeptidase/acylaminoacyl peptidase